MPVGHGKKSRFTFFEVEKSHFRSKKAIFSSYSIIKNLKKSGKKTGICVGTKQKYCLFPVTRPTLILGVDPSSFFPDMQTLILFINK